VMKICPDCRYDYQPHVENCANCGAALLTREEYARRQEERRQCEEKALEDPVAVREGDIRWIGELHGVLIDSGIPSRVLTDPGCAGGCRGHASRLAVSRQDAERAHRRIEDYFAELHPEVRVSQELMSEGKCPACGYAVEGAAAECPDCGLTLGVIE